MYLEIGPTNSFGLAITLDKYSFTVLIAFIFFKFGIDDTTEAESL
jgi:hypothetical protein